MVTLLERKLIDFNDLSPYRFWTSTTMKSKFYLQILEIWLVYRYCNANVSWITLLSYIVIFLVKLNCVPVLQLQFKKLFLKPGSYVFHECFYQKNTYTYSFFCRSWIWKEIEYQFCQTVLKIWSTCKHWIWKVMMYMYFLIVDMILGSLILTAYSSSSHC